jgi:hypothetical protein
MTKIAHNNASGPTISAPAAIHAAAIQPRILSAPFAIALPCQMIEGRLWPAGR